MGLFTKAADFDDVMAFVDAVSRGDDRIADPIGERIWKTKAKSIGPVIEALLFLAQAAAQHPPADGQAKDPREYVHCYKSDSDEVLRAKLELAEAFWGSSDPVTTANEVMSKHAANPRLSNVDRVDNLLSVLWGAADLVRDRDIKFKFGDRT